MLYRVQIIETEIGYIDNGFSLIIHYLYNDVKFIDTFNYLYTYKPRRKKFIKEKYLERYKDNCLKILLIKTILRLPYKTKRQTYACAKASRFCYQFNVRPLYVKQAIRI